LAAREAAISDPVVEGDAIIDEAERHEVGEA
jgi:hypothetical protein